MRAKNLYLRLIIVFASMVILSSPTDANAQTQQNTIQMAISPQVLDLQANRGDVITNQFRLTNGSEESITVRATPKNFTPQGEEGAIDLTEKDTSYSIAAWLNAEPSLTTIPANKTHDFTVTMRVPDNAEPGSRFGSIVFATIPPESSGSGAKVSQEIAPVILVTVAGDLIESASIEDFYSLQTVWSKEPEIVLQARIRNNGNVHFKPSGVVEIFDMLGNSVAKVSLEDKNVLPDSIRKIDAKWLVEGFKVGKYRAELTLVYGENDEIVTAKTSFYIFPYQTIVPLIAGIALISILTFRYRKRIKLALKVLSGKDVT